MNSLLSKRVYVPVLHELTKNRSNTLRSHRRRKHENLLDVQKKTALFRRFFGGLYWTRTSDPIDVNDVLYQLSQQTRMLFQAYGETKNEVDYQLSQQTEVGFSICPFVVIRHIRTVGTTTWRLDAIITGDAIYSTTAGRACQSQTTVKPAKKSKKGRNQEPTDIGESTSPMQGRRTSTKRTCGGLSRTIQNGDASLVPYTAATKTGAVR